MVMSVPVRPRGRVWIVMLARYRLRRRAPRRGSRGRWPRCLLLQAELSALDPGDERRPGLAGELQFRPGHLLGVAHGHDAGEVGRDLDALPAVGAAVTARAPL